MTGATAVRLKAEGAISKALVFGTVANPEANHKMKPGCELSRFGCIRVCSICSLEFCKTKCAHAHLRARVRPKRRNLSQLVLKPATFIW